MNSLLVAAAFLLQANPAEDAFRKIEEGFEKAKTISVRFRIALPLENEVSGVLLLKKGNKIRCELSGSKRLLFVSNGTRMELVGEKAEQEAPAFLYPFFVTGLARGSAEGLAAFAYLAEGRQKAGDSDLKKYFVMSELRQGTNDGSVRTLAYKLKGVPPSPDFVVKLWYDPNTYRLLRRSCGPSEEVPLEIYEEFSIDADIPDSQFEIPKWRPLFDGRTLDYLSAECRPHWKIVDGALTKVPTSNYSAQSQEEYEDGEIRLSFEVKKLTYLGISVRQGGEGSDALVFNEPQLPPLEGKRHEVLFRCRGAIVTANWDGKLVPLATRSRARRGHIHVFGAGESLRIFSIEYRPCESFEEKKPSSSRRPVELKVLGEGRDLYGDPLPAGVLARAGSLRVPGGAGVFLPNGEAVATAGTDGAIRFWEKATGREVRSFAAHTHRISAIAFSSDGAWMASAGEDHLVRVWDLKAGKESYKLEGFEMPVTSIAFSRDGKSFAAASLSGRPDRSVILYDTATGREQRRLHGHFVTSVSFAPDGKVLATGGHETGSSIRVWDLAAGKEIVHLAPTAKDSGYVNGIRFSPDGTVILSQNQEGTLSIWDVASFKERYKLEGGADFEFSPDGTILATIVQGPSIRLVEVKSGKELRRIPAELGMSLHFSSDRAKLTCCGPGGFRTWDVASGKEEFRLEAAGDPISRIALSNDGRLLATGGTGGIVRLWEAATGKELKRLEGHRGYVSCLRFLNDGKSVLAAGMGDRDLRTWNLETGKDSLLFKEEQANLGPVALRSDGSMVIASRGSTNRIRVSSVRAGVNTTLLEYFQSGIGWVIFSDDGRLVMSGGFRASPQLWDVATGKQLLDLRRASAMETCVAFSPDGKVAAIGDSEGRIRLVELGAGGELLPLEEESPNEDSKNPYERSVRSVAFSPDGKMIASGTDGGTLRLWDAPTRTVLLKLRCHRAAITSLGFSADGTVLVTGSSDRTALVWKCPSPLGR